MAADYQNSQSVPSNIKTGRVSDAPISAMGNLCGLLKFFHISIKLKKNQRLLSANIKITKKQPLMPVSTGVIRISMAVLFYAFL